ncbi:CoA pyrophosphatase [Geomonas sp. RF6]|uniref:NUDIX hydrolase n=1 Tax=Geomonas sp. RF6 TaxID=2897342 RepID=UPI001E37ABF1|nr:CoA pyrophosphatase [Geomonas sp. RF6]UFS71811.1 CoA pyrophosphatase [Geomonas sp. RF6]
MTSPAPPAHPRNGATGAPGLPSALQKALAARERVPLEPGSVPAAVLLPLFIRHGEYHILFTKRTSHLTHHSGEISFPGGVAEPEDRDPVQTALRETHEELGIPPEDVAVLGILDDFLSIHGYLVTPVVGVIPADLSLTVSEREIERVIEVPLGHLLGEGAMRTEHWPPWKEGVKPMYFFTWRGDEIWGLTARILKQFLDVVVKLPDGVGVFGAGSARA